MENQNVWKKIKEREYDIPNQNEIFNLIETHLDRVEFVRDHIGLRDFLFIAESGTQGFYISTLFIATDVEASKRNTMSENDEAFHEKLNEDPIGVLKELQSFFANTNRTLYMGIGFMETTSQEMRDTKVPIQDMDGELQEISLLEATIIAGLQSGKYRSPQEAMKDLRKFPDWYTETSVMPEETEQVTVEEEKQAVAETLLVQKLYLKGQINEALDRKDKEAFIRFSRLLNELQENAH